MKKCEYCQKDFEEREKEQRFCGKSCVAFYTNERRPPRSEEHKRKQSESLKKTFAANPELKRAMVRNLKTWAKENPEKVSRGEKHALCVAKYTKGRYKKDPKNIFDFSHRTRVKIMSRLNLPCSKCGWNVSVCDVHHIFGKKIEDCNNHKNLSCLCPNCHRLAGKGKIKKEELMTFEEQVGERWRDVYYG